MANGQTTAPPAFQGYGQPQNWSSTSNYPIGQTVAYAGSIWRAVVTNRASTPSLSNTDWVLVVAGGTGALIAPEVTVTLTLTPEQIQGLNSFPVDIVVAADANTFIALGQLVFIGSRDTSGTYSAPPIPSIQYAGGPDLAIDASATWDGSAVALTLIGSVAPAIAVDEVASVGLNVQITSSTDVTGGDASCTVILTYRAYNIESFLASAYYSMLSVNQSGPEFIVNDLGAVLADTTGTFTIVGSTGNDGTYTLASPVISASGFSVLVTVESIPDATADGWAVFA